MQLGYYYGDFAFDIVTDSWILEYMACILYDMYILGIAQTVIQNTDQFRYCHVCSAPILCRGKWSSVSLRLFAVSTMLR